MEASKLNEGHFQAKKGDFLVRMELKNSGWDQRLDLTLFDTIAFELYDMPVTCQFLRDQRYDGWFENPSELMLYLKSEFDTLVITENRYLMFTMMVNPKLNKQKDFVFWTTRREKRFDQQLQERVVYLQKQNKDLKSQLKPKQKNQGQDHNKRSLEEQLQLLQRHHKSVLEQIKTEIEVDANGQAIVKVINQDEEQPPNFSPFFVGLPKNMVWRYDIRVKKITGKELAVQVGTQEIFTSARIGGPENKETMSYSFNNGEWWGYGEGGWIPNYLSDESLISLDLDLVKFTLVLWLNGKVMRYCEIPKPIHEKELFMAIDLKNKLDTVELTLA